MKLAISRGALPTLLCLLAVAVFAPRADASRALLSEAALGTDQCAKCSALAAAALPPPEGQIEGACGAAISTLGEVYVADYYHRVVDRFGAPSAGTPGNYLSQIALPGSNPVLGVNTLDSVCGLAFDAAGNLYGNEWHQGVVQLTGGEATIDSGESTGLAIDPSSNRLYVDGRTYLTEYALPFDPGDEPLAKIGLGGLGEGFGLAAAGGRLYVADASAQAVKVFDPAVSATSPVKTISGVFNSLTDAALAIDPTNDHLLVVDNLQPGFEHPNSAVLEFGSPADGYAFLGQLPGAPVDGGPSGVAVSAGGQVVVTDGNGELANAYLYGPYQESASAPAAPARSVAVAAVTDAAASGGGGNGGGGTVVSRRARRSSASISEVSQSGGVRVSFQGSLSPRALPRRRSRPVVATVGAKIIPLGERVPPQLRRIEIAINRYGHFHPGVLPVCHIAQIQPATTGAALSACRRSLVGEGTFSAKVLLPQQAPFPSTGKVYAFNGRWHGRPAILAHVYGTEPLPVSYTLPFELLPRRGTYGTLLRASLPAVTGNAGYVTGLSLAFGRGHRARGYVSAGCPAPAGFSVASFSFARVDFAFSGGRKVGATLIRSCNAKG